MENWKNKQVRRGSVDRTYTRRIELSMTNGLNRPWRFQMPEMPAWNSRAVFHDIILIIISFVFVCFKLLSSFR